MYIFLVKYLVVLFLFVEQIMFVNWLLDPRVFANLSPRECFMPKSRNILCGNKLMEKNTHYVNFVNIL